MYVSDSGIKLADKGATPTKTDAVYVIEKGKAKALAKGEELGHPKLGLLTTAGDKVWVVTFGSGELYSLDKNGKKGTRPRSYFRREALDGIVSSSVTACSSRAGTRRGSTAASRVVPSISPSPV